MSARSICFSLLSALGIVFLTVASASAASCPYSSVQVRVQPDTSQPWATSTTVDVGQSVHVGVFRNGWGMPVDAGTVTVYAVQGSSWQLLNLNTWETYFTGNYPATWSFIAYCGSSQDTASATFVDNSNPIIDVLSYILPFHENGSANGGTHALITDPGNAWRTFSPGGNVGERLPGFYLTKGKVYGNDAWNFEQMIYDNNWIYLVRDTSWTAKCLDNNREAGMLLFTYEYGEWKRGGRHFPRFIENGTSIWTGNKFIQGVEKKLHPKDTTAQEGRWCNAEHSGTTTTEIQAELSASEIVGGDLYNDVLKLRAIGGSGEGDEWWFAKNVGLIHFHDNDSSESAAQLVDPHEIGVRIPCGAATPCM